VTVCPLCQANLDLDNVNGRKGSPGKMPILYFTQLIGLAIGCTPKELGLQHGLAPIGIEAPPLPIGSGRS
jgi:heterodisulfide reductase subunit B